MIETESLNKTPQEIDKMYHVLSQSIRNYMSRILEDNKATEENPIPCRIILEQNACGISFLELPHIVSIFQDSEGIIWCNTNWYSEPVDFSELSTDCQMDIVREIVFI